MGKKRLLMRIVQLVVAFVLIAASTQVISADSGARFNMSYIYFGNSSLYTGIVDNAKGSINDISPSYFDLNVDGSLKLTPAVDSKFINDMHNRNIRVTPFLSNHWDRAAGTAALANRDALASQIADVVSNYNLDGINVDLENLDASQRNNYTDLVRLLRQKLPAGKSVSAAVTPNPNDFRTGINGAYDFSALSQYCDYLMLMTYDEHYQGGPEGPVAGAPFVEASVKEALKYVPSNKLILGIAFYGRLWKQGASYGGYGISNNTVDTLISKYHGVVTYDNSSNSPEAVITINPEDVKPVVFGQTLDAGKYDIWYENEDSIKYKLELVKKYDLKGTGSWSLGQESADTWGYYGLWLNGVYFSDVVNYWAEQSIITMADKGWMVGTGDTLFQPELALTRAQAAVILVRALGLDDTSAVTLGPGSFTDTTNHWAVREIEIARQHNIVQGVGGGRFAPDAPLTREQMAVMLARVMTSLPKNNGIPVGFSDVNASSWSFDSIAQMVQNGIIKGYPDGLFHPLDVITRAQMAVLMDRSSGYFTGGPVLAGLQ